MRYADSLVGFMADLEHLILFACARKKRSAVGEGFNAVIKTPYTLVNRGKKLHTKGRDRVKQFLRHKFAISQLLLIGYLTERLKSK